MCSCLCRCNGKCLSLQHKSVAWRETSYKIQKGTEKIYQ